MSMIVSFTPRRAQRWGSAAFVIAAAWLVFHPGTAAAQPVDINAMMPCGTPDLKGKQSPEACTATRALLMQQCTSCHTFVPIVRQQKGDGEWDGTIARHRERLNDVSEAELESIGQFLKDHFRPDRDVPQLPQELIDNDPGVPPA